MTTRRALAALIVPVAALVGCNSSDSGLEGPPHSGIEAGYPDSSSADAAADGTSAFLSPLPAVADPGPGGFLITTSGEKLALSGYPFTPGASQAADPALVDGWEIKFDAVIVTLDHITLSESPNTSPTDQSITGKQVAHLEGPFAVDLHKGGPLPGKGGEGERAVAIGAIASQNDNGGSSFDPELPYALGFDSVVASPKAWNVNLDAQGLVDYQDAIANGWSTMLIGTATYKGPEPAADSEFSKLPTTVHFRFGFPIPTSYVNCQNPENGTGFTNEEYGRGVRSKANASTIVQLTVHTDHLFWEKLSHEQPMHFDQIACAYVGIEAPIATLPDMDSLDFSGFYCKDGHPLPPRSLVSDYAPVAGQILYFDPNGVSGLPKYKDYLMYSVSTQGHLNSDGLCAVRRHYPSPP
ncbi:MAG: hypothetical protein HY898_00045 [Deltaproteobacteria bacterium]|nr:hypothetical protein [Deltaproteobacteria bacterium]